MEESEGFGSEVSYFQEKQQVLDLIRSSYACKSTNQFEDDYSLLNKILSKYQEQSQLLEPHLGDMMEPLNEFMLEYVSGSTSLTTFHRAGRMLQLLCRVRGYKRILKFFPHEVKHIELCWVSLSKQNRTDFDLWECRYVLLLWMSVLCLIPFDISSIDSKQQIKSKSSSELVHSIVEVCKAYLCDPGPTREAASVCLSSLLTRPDVEATHLHDFLMWCAGTLNMTKVIAASAESFQMIGVLHCLPQIFKKGHRSKLLTYAPVVLVPCLSFTAMLNETLCRKLLCKLHQRIALTFMPPRIAEWRYTRGNRRINLGGSVVSAGSATTQSVAQAAEEKKEEEQQEEAYVPIELESIIDKILECLCDKDTVVRWSAAKGIGRITMLLPKAHANDVIEAVLELFQDDEADSNWHGGCLALAELSRRGLLLPEHLANVVPFIERAIVFDVLRGQHSVGSHVRDAACYVCWSFARAYSPAIMAQYTESLSSAMMMTTLFDREISCRRAACAAFQESVGRQGSENFPRGMDIIAVADYFSIGNRTNAYLNIAPVVAQMDGKLLSALLKYLCEVKIYHWDAVIRSLASKSVALLLVQDIDKFSMHLDAIIENCLSKKFTVRHGALLTVAEVFYALSLQDYSVPASLNTNVVGIVAKLEKARLYTGKGGELVRQAVCYLIECIAKACAVIPLTTQLSFVESLNSHLIQPFEVLQGVAADALRQVLHSYFPVKPVDQEKFRKITVYKYISDLNTSENVAVTRGSALALGALPPAIFMHSRPLIDSLLECVEGSAATSRQMAGEYDAETSRNSVEALIEVSEKASESANWSVNDFFRVFSLLRTACENYSIDKRGDVGSWSRTAALQGFERLLTATLNKEDLAASALSVDHSLLQQGDCVVTSMGMARVTSTRHFSSCSRSVIDVQFAPQSLGDSMMKKAAAEYLSETRMIVISGSMTVKRRTETSAAPSLITRELSEEVFAAVLKQLSEKMDTVRSVAGGVLIRLLPLIGSRLAPTDWSVLNSAVEAVLVDIVADGEGVKSINWAQPGQVYSVVTSVMRSPRFFHSILSGLVLSMGERMSPTLAKVAMEKLDKLFISVDETYVQLLRVSVVKLFTQFTGKDRVISPLLVCTKAFLQVGALSTHSVNNSSELRPFYTSLLVSVIKELKATSILAKIILCLDIVMLVMQLDDGLARFCAVKCLVNYTGHSNFRVREHCATELHLQLEVDCNLLNPVYGADKSRVCGFFKSADDLEEAKSCLATTHWASDKVEVVGSSKSLLVALCQLAVVDHSALDPADIEVISKLFPAKGVKSAKVVAKVVDEYDSYEGLVKVADMAINEKTAASLLKKALEEKKNSYALTQALTHVKEFMTDSQKSLILLREGRLLMDSGDFKGAIDCFNEGISYNPSVTLFNMKGACHKSLEMYSEAYFDYSYTIRLEPEVGSHYCSRGLCLAKLKKFDMAIEDLDIAVQLDPSVNHLYSRALTFADFGKYELAIEDYTTAIGDDTTAVANELKTKCKYRRALAYFELQQFDSVVRDCTSVLHADPNNVAIRALLGRSLKILNEHKKGEEHLTMAIQLDEFQASLYSERGDIRFRTGQKNKIIEAIYDFDKAVKLLENKLSVGSSSDRLTAGRVLTGAKVSKGTLSSFNLSKLVEAENSTEDAEKAAAESNKPAMDPIASILRNNSKHINVPSSSSGGGGGGGGGGMKPAALTRSNSILSVQSQGGVSVSGLTNGQTKEIEEQLAETLFKRAQAKLMVSQDAVNVESALVDAVKSSSLMPDDDDYQMVIATCYIRLNRYNDAKRVLQNILNRSPDNYKALYNFSFCQRASGNRNTAIEGLTKVISACSQDMESFSTNSLSFAIDKVYEMRGLLFHEMQAHKLALQDLGRAIAINPLLADTYFVRGDCHSKLGNYEQALMDFNTAESKQFDDKCSLFVSRGHVLRLLGQCNEAMTNFQEALELLDATDMIGRVRILSFIAFCQIDTEEYLMALESLTTAAQCNEEVLSEKESNYGPYKGLKGGNLNPNESAIVYLKRVEWILLYHIALCHYMAQDFEGAEAALMCCIDESLMDFVADDVAYGTQLYFLSLTLIQLKKFDKAASYLSQCSQTHWVHVRHNQFLYTYTSAKLMQCQGQHKQAVEEFTAAIQLNPDNAYCYFRRGWSQKSVGNFAGAGNDFEQAKILKPNDPNFSLDYRKIHTMEYMVIGSEPDLTERFPALLPIPGMQIR